MSAPAPKRNPAKTLKLPLFKLERGEGHPSDDGYDQTDTYVIAAENESEAREMAYGNESRSTRDIWLDETITTCEKIAKGSKFVGTEIVCRDFNAG